MAYDASLAARVRDVLSDEFGVVEKKMFGGVAFMLRGNMCVGIVKDDLLVRVGKENHAAAVALPHARVMDFTGKPMQGFIYVSPQGVATESDLRAWVGPLPGRFRRSRGLGGLDVLPCGSTSSPPKPLLFASV